MLRFGVLGAGRIGKVHARTIAASGKARVAYLADAMPKAAEDLAAEVGARVASVEDIIRAKDVDAALHAIVAEQGGMTPEAAVDWVKQFKKDGRYQRDVY